MFASNKQSKKVNAAFNFKSNYLDKKATLFAAKKGDCVLHL